MDYWNGLQGSNSQLLLFFHTVSNRVSMASHTAMKINARQNCIRINGGILRENWSWCGQCMHAYALKQCSKHCHTPGYCRSSHFQLEASHRPSHSCHPISVIVMSYADILYCHIAPFPPNSCVSFPLYVKTSIPITYAFSLWGGGGGGGGGHYKRS